MENKSFFKKLIGFSSASYINLFVTLLSTFIVTRVFAPDTLGKINLFLTCQNILISVSLLGLDQAFCRFYYEMKTKDEQNEVFSFCIVKSILIALIISFIGIPFWQPVSKFIVGYDSFIIFICLVFSSLFHIMCRYFNIHQRMEQKVLGYTILAVLITLAHKLSYLASPDKSSSSAIVMITISFLLICLIYYIFKFKYVIIFKKHYLNKRLKVKLNQFALPLMPVSLLSWLNSSLPQFFMKFFLDYSAIGIYSNAVVIASAINLLQSGFNIIWTPFVYENYKTKQEEIGRIHNIISFLMVAFGLMLLFFQDIIYLFIGKDYRASQMFFAFVIISPICYTIAETTGIGINLSKKSYLHLFAYGSCILANVILCFILIPFLGLVGVGISVALASIVSLIVKTILGEKYYKCVTNYAKTFSAIFIMFIAATVNFVYFSSEILKYSLFVLFLFLLILLYRKELLFIIQYIKAHKVKGR